MFLVWVMIRFYGIICAVICKNELRAGVESISADDTQASVPR